MRSDGFISKKDQLKTKGEFGVGAEERTYQTTK